MNSAIICEGTTDMLLIGYMLQEKYNWKFQKTNTNYKGLIEYKDFSKNKNSLRLYVADGIDNIINKFEEIKSTNYKALHERMYFNKVVILIDNDEEYSTQNFISKFNETISIDLQNVNIWCEFKQINRNDEEKTMDLKIVCIPKEKIGAMELFLLDILSKQDETDKKIIDKCYNFIDGIKASQDKYLKARNKEIKAKFNAYFSVRLSGESYNEFTKVFKEIKWETYDEMDEVFNYIQELEN